MGLRKNRLSFAEARAIEIVGYLAACGYQPAKIRGHNFWYHSPLRNERTPSFKVNITTNRWYDFGIGKGGSIIDFGIAYYGCGAIEFLDQLESKSFLPRQNAHTENVSAPAAPRITVTGSYRLSAPSLLAYLAVRNIPVYTARNYCSQVTYTMGNKSYFGIGFKNDSGGYEIRNPYYKTCSSPKDITTIKSGCDSICVFEGFFDFLSFLALFPEQAGQHDFLILNSLAFFERSRPVMEGYNFINLYLDNDAAGKKTCLYAHTLDKRYRDMSVLYENHKDLNDFLSGNSIPPISLERENPRPP